MASNDVSKRRPKADRQRALRRGHVSEYLAAALLLLKGYRILAMRYRTRLGEIDLIARKGDIIAFVEVKARRAERDAIDAVGFETQRRIRAASDLWLAKRPDVARLSSRYDIVTVRPGRLPRHFQDAF